MRTTFVTLWDLIAPKRPAPAPSARKAPTRPTKTTTNRNHAAIARYDALTKQLLNEHNIRVRKWRSSMTGVAWQVDYHDGTTTRLIEAPRPRGPMSAAVFLHEVGHHAIGFHRYKPRCLEEHHAWAWALEAMLTHDIQITAGVERRVRLSMRYAIAKAQRRGIKALPAEMAAYL